MSFSAAQCRAARALIGWSQDQLSGASKVAKATIANFEAAKREPYPRTLDDLRSALEAAGVEFINGSQPGVQLQPAFLLSPVDLAKQIWKSSMVREPIWIRAKSEAEARELAKQATIIATRVRPGVVSEGSPWPLREAAVCEQGVCPFALPRGVIINAGGAVVGGVDD